MSIFVGIAMGAIPVAKWSGAQSGAHQIRPVITLGAEAMDKVFANEH